MKNLERRVKKYLTDRSWDNLKPADLAKSISIEAAELLELFQWSDEQLAEVRKDKNKLGLIKKELADVLIYCIDLSVLLELNTEKIIMDKLNHIIKKYPAQLMKNRIKKAGNDDLYLKIKQDYRRRGVN